MTVNLTDGMHLENKEQFSNEEAIEALPPKMTVHALQTTLHLWQLI
ncbi:hypothetical protein CV093_18620 [Oceanobacillus sp. 143]|nr:hypothetical protein [Oceanobacillus zhaokaii]QGS69561.1 hypothetical protein CV093_18620 [Oceanobacillus sp. 143]